MTPSYPPPPWQMHGRATIQPLLVRAADVALPERFRATATLGRTTGLIAYIEYLPPSPLTYRELIFMPAFVSAAGARGYYVAAMYVDDATTLLAGRREWALPKRMAAFEARGGAIRVTADDGACIEVTASARGPALPLRAAVATVQADPPGIVRFKSTFRGRARWGKLTARVLEPTPAWDAFASATTLPGGVALESFEATMHARSAARRHD
jgi:hypothetical protein